MNSGKPGSQPSVRALERGLDILGCFHGASTPIPLTTIAGSVDLSLSTTLRILGTLERKGFITRDDSTKRYSLGPRLLGLASAAQRMNDLAAIALPFMQDLNTLHDETISLYIASGTQRVCIQRIDSTQTLRQVVSIGDILPLGVGSGGKVLTAWLAVEDPNFDLVTYAPTLSRASIEQIRQNGFATSFNERGEGIYGVAAPVRNHLGKVVAALSLSGPTARFHPEKLASLAVSIVDKAREISVAQGWSPEK